MTLLEQDDCGSEEGELTHSATPSIFTEACNNETYVEVGTATRWLGAHWHGMSCLYFIPPSVCLHGLSCCTPASACSGVRLGFVGSAAAMCARGDGVLETSIHGVEESPGRSSHGELCLQSSDCLVSCSISSGTSPLPNPRCLTLAL